MMDTAEKKPRRLTEKQVSKILREYDFREKVVAFLGTLETRGLVWYKPARVPAADATPFDEIRWRAPITSYREIVVLTKVGMLGLSIYEDSVCCIFEEPHLAARYFDVGANGKWNHHAFVGYCHGPSSREYMERRLHLTLIQFMRDVQQITREATDE